MLLFLCLGMAADVGTLQRLPKVVGNDSLVRELCYSARKMMADEAVTCGLVSRVFPDKTRYAYHSTSYCIYPCFIRQNNKESMTIGIYTFICILVPP